VDFYTLKSEIIVKYQSKNFQKTQYHNKLLKTKKVLNTEI